MLKVALPVWNGRIAPVFDVASQIRLLEVDSGRMVAETAEAVGALTPAEKALRLAESGVDLLLCGAISRVTRVMVEAYGIRVVPFVTGDLACVVEALLADRLADAVHAMPGCRGGARRRRRGNRGFAEDGALERERNLPREVGGSGAGRGQGRSAVHPEAPVASGLSKGTAGRCVCPACGHEESHQRGVPCSQNRCPDCGSILVRR